MATSIFKLVEKRELSHDEAHKALGGHAHHVLRIDVGKGGTTIYFEADKGSAEAKPLLSRAVEVKPADVARL